MQDILGSEISKIENLKEQQHQTGEFQLPIKKANEIKKRISQIDNIKTEIDKEGIDSKRTDEFISLNKERHELTIQLEKLKVKDTIKTEQDSKKTEVKEDINPQEKVVEFDVKKESAKGVEEVKKSQMTEKEKAIPITKPNINELGTILEKVHSSKNIILELVGEKIIKRIC